MGMKKQSTGTIFWRVFFTALCLATYAFIFYNSARTGEESSAQSGSLTAWVQRLFKAIAPNSFIANAEGEAYEKLHVAIRTLAHFAEFGLLGASLVWCFASYTREGIWFIVPVALILFSPVLDECIQLFASARVADVHDLIVDTAGGYAGAIFGWITTAIHSAIRKRRKNGTERL